MHFSTVILVASLVSSSLAVPSIPSSFPPGAAVLSKQEVHELGRLARVINAAHCPSHRHLQPPSHLSTALAAHRTQSTSKRSSKKQYLKSGLEKGSNILASSHDARGKEEEDDEEFEEVEWFISHTPESQTLTVALSSLPFTDTYLSLLMSTPQPSSSFSFGKPSPLVPLPELLFPERLLSAYFPAGEPRPMIHHALAEEAEYVGAGLVLSLLEMIERPNEQSEEAMSKIEKLEVVGHGLGANVGLLVALSVHLHLQDPVRAIAFSSSDEEGNKVNTHGSPQGAATVSKIAQLVGQLASTAWSASSAKRDTGLVVKHSKRDQLKKEKAARIDGVEIDIHLFGMSRVGDLAFAKWVDELAGQHVVDETLSVGGKILGSYPLMTDAESDVSSASPSTSTTSSASHLHITRVNSFADPIPHLPSIGSGFAHFRSGEVWVDGDPRTVWDCDARRISEAAAKEPSTTVASNGKAYEFEGCANGVQMEKTSLLDHAGPYGGVWIGASSCE